LDFDDLVSTELAASEADSNALRCKYDRSIKELIELCARGEC
jgi:hypothetical protein